MARLILPYDLKDPLAERKLSERIRERRQLRGGDIVASAQIAQTVSEMRQAFRKQERFRRRSSPVAGEALYTPASKQDEFYSIGKFGLRDGINSVLVANKGAHLSSEAYMAANDWCEENRGNPELRQQQVVAAIVNGVKRVMDATHFHGSLGRVLNFGEGCRYHGGPDKTVHTQRVCNGPNVVAAAGFRGALSTDPDDEPLDFGEISFAEYIVPEARRPTLKEPDAPPCYLLPRFDGDQTRQIRGRRKFVRALPEALRKAFEQDPEISGRLLDGAKLIGVKIFSPAAAIEEQRIILLVSKAA